MQLPAKRKIVFAGIAALFVWPIVHHLVTDHYVMNHWRFGGWSMYTKPPPIVSVGVYTRNGTRAVPLQRVLARVPGGGEVLSGFAARRKLWGSLQGPDALARAVFDGAPRLGGMQIYVRSVEFDGSSAMATYRTSLYECRRDPADEPQCETIYVNRPPAER